LDGSCQFAKDPDVVAIARGFPKLCSFSAEGCGYSLTAAERELLQRCRPGCAFRLDDDGSGTGSDGDGDSDGDVDSDADSAGDDSAADDSASDGDADD
jgi:hypothetical protein